MFLYRKTSTGLFQIIPWDLDATWGISFDGYPQVYEGIWTNALYQRLFETNPEDFISRVKQRWDELRDSQFKESELKQHFSNHFKELQESGIIDVENRNWGKKINLQNEHVYIETWMTNRLIYLDNYFSTIE